MEVMKRILGFFVSKRQSASEYLKVAESQQFVLPRLGQPQAPDAGASDTDIFIWKEDYKEWKRSMKDRQENEGALFGLLLRQCTDQFLQAVREHSDWEQASNSQSSMALLNIFQYVGATRGSTNVDPVMMQVNAQEKYYSFRQGKDMANAEYYGRFMHHANVVRYCKCAMGASIDNLELICRDDNIPAPDIDQIKSKIAVAREREMAMVFLTHSCKKRYGNLVALAIKNRLLGSGNFPTTMAAALELLNNSKQLVAALRLEPASSRIWRKRWE